MALSGVAAAIACLAAAQGASAHATLNLYGKNAVANKTGTLTLTIPHGCGAGLATTKIVTRLGSSWQSARPAAVAGWTSTVKRASNGKLTLTWTATGAGLPNTDVGNFPIAVRWPKKAGTYNTPTAQYCGSQLMDWKDPFNAAADGDLPYPATYPVPRVRVHSSSAHAPTAVTGSSPVVFCRLGRPLALNQ
uniref:Unannotated protein n=1 Tax=freshwater metagenome TaxID=449393 RepID=A0A6J5ZLT1_9ZZZZ